MFAWPGASSSMVEQWTFNPLVLGSSPRGRTQQHQVMSCFLDKSVRVVVRCPPSSTARLDPAWIFGSTRTSKAVLELSMVVRGLRPPLCQGILTDMSVVVIAESLPVDPLEALRVLADSELELGRLRRERVVAARAAGASWQQVGDALGISRQSAWENFTADARGALAANVAANSSLDEDDAADLAVSEVSVVRRRRRSS